MPHMPQASDVPDEGGVHGFVEAGAGAAEEDGGGVLGGPEADGHVDDGDVDGGEDGEDGGEGLGLAGGGEFAQHQVADVEQPEQQHAGEARVPCPPDAPFGAAPEHAGPEADGGVDDGDLGGGEGPGVGGEGFEGIAAAPVEIEDGGDEVDVGEDEAHIEVGTW